MRYLLLSILITLGLHASLVEAVLLQKAKYSISGEFASYDFNGDGKINPSDWTFTTPQSEVYQLLGDLSEENIAKVGVFGWKLLNGFRANAPTFYLAFLSQDVDKDGSTKFDWVVVEKSSGSVYKLAGQDPVSKSFSYEAISGVKATSNADTNELLFTSVTSGTTSSVANANGYTLLAWNDLGMHCVDGKDYSIFSILPPYNNVNAQLIRKEGTSGKHMRDAVKITYTSAATAEGTYNTTSASKTNFWDYVLALFNVSLEKDVGLTSNKTPSHTPQEFKYNASHDWWEATGIPILNYDDNGKKNYYPMVNVTAKDLSGNVLATTKVVVPVSDEMDCKSCHGSNTNASSKPILGWENDTDSDKDYKLNILKLHDQKHTVASYLDALAKNGYKYSESLYETAKSGTPILCASCHKSNALATAGFESIPSLSKAVHHRHANVTHPTTKQNLGSTENKDACYACHPGQSTQCLRGAMGSADISCQSCHGSMSAVASTTREPWLDEPNCQSCHQDAKRHQEAVTSKSTGTLREALDNRFATNTNTPMQGKSLYRFSKGHGNMQCSACHGSTHAIYPSSHEDDNYQSIAVQGHKGTIAECTACHTSVPLTQDKGPHGMHSVGQIWVDQHGYIAFTESCTACHGADYRGSDLSKTFNARSFKKKYGTEYYTKGQKVGCYDCHNGPNDD